MKNNVIFALFMFFVVLLITAMCSSGGDSGSKRKWSDLSETEKDNARWAYEAQ